MASGWCRIGAVILILGLTACGAKAPDEAAPSSPKGVVGSVPDDPQLLGQCRSPEAIGPSDSFRSDTGHGIYLVSSISETAGELPPNVATGFSLKRFNVAVASIQRESSGMPELSGSGSLNLVADAPMGERIASELQRGGQVMIAVSPYNGPGMRGIENAVPFRQDGAAVFIGDCGYGSTQRFATLSKNTNRPASDLVRERLRDTPAFERTHTPPPVQPKRWADTAPEDRQVTPGETPPEVMATLATYGVAVEVPDSWLRNEEAMCTLTSVAMGECFRLSPSIGSKFQLRAYLTRGSVGERITLLIQPDGGGDPLTIFVSDALVGGTTLRVRFEGASAAGGRVASVESVPAIELGPPADLTPGMSIPGQAAPPTSGPPQGPISTVSTQAAAPSTSFAHSN